MRRLLKKLENHFRVFYYLVKSSFINLLRIYTFKFQHGPIKAISGNLIMTDKEAKGWISIDDLTLELSPFQFDSLCKVLIRCLEQRNERHWMEGPILPLYFK